MHWKLILNLPTNMESFFEWQKCHLNKSNEDGEREKARESSLIVSLSKDDTDIFEEGSEFPPCASILCYCWYNLEKKVNEIPELSFLTKKAQIKGARHVEEVNKSIKLINEKFEEIEEGRKKKKDKFGNYKMKRKF